MWKTAAIALLACASARAQECPLIQDEVDEFTHNAIVEVGGKFYTEFGVAVDLGFKAVNADHYMRFTYNTTGTMAIVVGADDAFMFKLDNDSIVTMHSVDVQSGDINPGRYGGNTLLRCLYRTTLADLNALATTPCAKIRWYTREGYNEKELNEKARARLMTYANCMLTKPWRPVRK